MTDNVPLIFDAQDNRIKELPVGNNLNLTGSGVVNADSIAITGSLTVNSITINSQSLSTVAFSNNYEDLDNTPTGFTGDYNDLTNKPTIPGILKNLSDVSGDDPVGGDALVYDALEGLYRPQSIINQTDLDALTLGALNNVIIVGNVTDRFLKFTAGAWRPSRVQYAEVQNTPTAVSAFTNDAGYLTQQDLESGIDITPTGDLTGSVFSDDSTLLVDGVNGKIVGDIESGVVNVDATTGDVNITSVTDDIVITAADNIQLTATDNVNIYAQDNVIVESNGQTSIRTDVANANHNFIFRADGDIEFPDSTIQSTAWTGAYTPTTSSDWSNPAPTTIQEALDRIAAALTALGQQA